MNFEYAKEAVHLEIKEYMLKPISAIELSESLMKLKTTLDREREEKLNVKNWKTISRRFYQSCSIIFYFPDRGKGQRRGL